MTAPTGPMLTVWEAMVGRRSIGRPASTDVPDQLIEQILEAARLAPSGADRQPWRFLVARDEETRRRLWEMCFGHKFVEEVPAVVVCFGDLDSCSQAAGASRRQEWNETAGGLR